MLSSPFCLNFLYHVMLHAKSLFRQSFFLGTRVTKIILDARFVMRKGTFCCLSPEEISEKHLAEE